MWHFSISPLVRLRFFHSQRARESGFQVIYSPQLMSDAGDKGYTHDVRQCPAYIYIQWWEYKWIWGEAPLQFRVIKFHDRACIDIAISGFNWKRVLCNVGERKKRRERRYREKGVGAKEAIVVVVVVAHGQRMNWIARSLCVVHKFAVWKMVSFIVGENERANWCKYSAWFYKREFRPRFLSARLISLSRNISR